MANQQKYYTNQAFCQQSEFYHLQRSQRALSPQRTIRQSPIGAQTPLRILDTSTCDNNSPTNSQDGEDYEEQEFYEEMLVDDTGIIKEKKFVVVAQQNDGKKYIQTPQYVENRQETMYRNNQKHRYEYIPMQEQDPKMCIPVKESFVAEKQVEVAPGRVHRYAVIESEEENKNERYALVPLEELNAVVSAPNHRYEYIPDSPKKNNRYEYIQQTSPARPMQSNQHRYEYIEQKPRVGNPVATQKLHELLSTPKKPQKTPNTPQKMLSPQLPKKSLPSLSPIQKEFQAQNKTQQRPSRSSTPKAQQKLNYALGTRQIQTQEKRLNPTMVAPMCSSPIQSVYSETTYSNKSESWMNLSNKKASGHIILGIAALMMSLCGAVTSGLCFYMMSLMGKLYYLEFGVVAGSVCLLLGLMGFRSRNVYWLPNRNYILGYLVLSIFSLFTCVGLLILLFERPKRGTPLADMTSVAVCGFSIVSLLTAAVGVLSSYCCTYPPPDNRVQHCVQGFTV